METGWSVCKRVEIEGKESRLKLMIVRVAGEKWVCSKAHCVSQVKGIRYNFSTYLQVLGEHQEDSGVGVVKYRKWECLDDLWKTGWFWGNPRSRHWIEGIEHGSFLTWMWLHKHVEKNVWHTRIFATIKRENNTSRAGKHLGQLFTLACRAGRKLYYLYSHTLVHRKSFIDNASISHNTYCLLPRL